MPVRGPRERLETVTPRVFGERGAQPVRDGGHVEWRGEAGNSARAAAMRSPCPVTGASTHTHARDRTRRISSTNARSDPVRL
jgi:hypothetical protein